MKNVPILSNRKGLVAKNIPDAIQEEVEEQARVQPRVKSYLDGKEVIKVIYVPGKILNFVVGTPATQG